MTSKRLLTKEARVLFEAADYIETYGHHKGALYDYNTFLDRPAACAVGAITAVGLTPGSSSMGPVFRKLERQINSSIGYWNDTHTKEEVIAALREAALSD